MMSNGTAKPFKVWDASRTQKKSLVASSLQQLKNKGREKLCLAGDAVTVVLETDGTEVDDEDYFLFLDDNTCFLILEPGQEWRARRAHIDEVDNGELELEEADGDDEDQACSRLAKTLKNDLSQIVTFSSDELQDLVDGDTEQLAEDLKISVPGMRRLQTSCQEYLDDRQRAREGLEFIQLLKQAQDAQERQTIEMMEDEVDGGGGKRKRHKVDYGDDEDEDEEDEEEEGADV